MIPTPIGRVGAIGRTTLQFRRRQALDLTTGILTIRLNVATLFGMMRTCFTVLLALGATLLLAGCMTVQERFPAQAPEQVWTALKAAAETPAYDDWVVDRNEVWISEEERRIEIYRQLDRVLHRPGYEPLREDRTWRFQVTLEATDPPQATFVSRGMGVPAHAQLEGERYFDLVWEVLGGRPQDPQADETDEADETGGSDPAAGPANLYYNGTR